MKTVIEKFVSKRGNVYSLVKRGRKDFVITKRRPDTRLHSVYGAYDNDSEAIESFNKLKDRYGR